MNKYVVYHEPEKSFKEIFKEIESAKKSIYLESYRISNDKIGRELVDLLLKKSSEGVLVKVIVDYLGWGNFSNKKKREIKNSEMEVFIFNPLFQNFSYDRAKKFWNIHHRDHRKLTIIDEKIAFVGGTNYTERELAWRDIMVKIKGEIVSELVSASNEMLGIAKRRPFDKRRIYKKLSQHFNLDDILVRQIPYSKHRLLKKELMKIFDSAQKEIFIATPYLIPDLKFRRSLKRAKKRGVKVQIIIPNKTDLFIANIMNNFGCYLIDKANIEIFMYSHMMHAKYLIVDGEVASFGSANLDYQTFNHNYELNIISKNVELTKQLRKIFRRDRKSCQKYHRKNWMKRSFLNKIMTRILVRYKRHF